jgi:2-isopropylmalate synthase
MATDPKGGRKYGLYRRVDLKDRQWPDRVIEKAPIWCSVDLRDGNQALAIPMDGNRKVKFFEQLVEIGFKEIEVGFPSASDTEFAFARTLIDEGRIPDDVAIQVLTQAREHLIRKTFESLRGAKQAIVHVYNSTSPMQREITFGKTKEEIKKIAVEGVRLVKSLLGELPDTNIRLEYSPESYSDTEVEYALEVCEAVMEVWEPTVENPIILNLPATVEVAPPNIYADSIEWFCKNLKERDKALISLHTHNDRGTGTAATELALMAGADRVEGTLFGNGERTGNQDLVTTALNLFVDGVDPGLDFSNLDRIRKVYEHCTRMTVPERQPYSGELVFTAFSGSHQDAIKKGFDRRARLVREEGHDPAKLRWEVPYLSIDPYDLGRTYEAIIRINSQSGKGGVAHVLDRDYGLDLPKPMHPEIGNLVSAIADKRGKELTSEEVYHVFMEEFVRQDSPLKIFNLQTLPIADGGGKIEVKAAVRLGDQELQLSGIGNGPINGFVHALEIEGLKTFTLADFRQHAIGSGSATDSASYILLEMDDGRKVYGCGIHSDTGKSGIYAIISAFNRASS